ncbi:hypothetical protein OB920_00320 [Halobacteria archaeon HArc-gm2]|nr:hypothetical protein [Halobacteria archaeon HArc-gm2]
MSLDVSRRFLEDGTRLVTILGFWAAVGFLFPPVGQSFVTNAGTVMALLYAAIRGVTIAEHAAPAYSDPTPKGVLRDNATALFAAGPWLLVAWLVVTLPWVHGEYVGQFLRLVAFAFGWTGVAIVVMYAVSTGIAALRDAGAIE